MGILLVGESAEVIQPSASLVQVYNKYNIIIFSLCT